MTKSTYPTKYQLEHLKKRINNEIDPLIDQAQLSVKSIVADLTETAELKLAKKIKADVVIKELEQAIENLEIKQRKAQTFFGKIKDPELKDKLNYKFDKTDKDNYYSRSNYGSRGIMPDDCRDQLREWAQYLAQIEADKTPEGAKVKELKLYKQSAINSVFECGVPEQLNIVLEKVLNGVGIVWNKTKALQLENKGYN
jgi:predicted XRE-type DNA-binding protein